MRIPTGSTNRLIFFVARDIVDLFTRETGLAAADFTVYYKLDDGSLTLWPDTPPIVEVGANMPGAYTLALDESGATTLDAANDEETLMLQITHASIDPITMSVEIYRPKITAGRTLGADASGALSVCTLNTDMKGTDGANTTTPPTVAAIADGVQLELIADHSGTAGSLAEFIELIKDISEADTVIDTSDATQWVIIWNKKGTSTEIMRKNMIDINAAAVTATTAVVGAREHTTP